MTPAYSKKILRQVLYGSKKSELYLHKKIVNISRYLNCYKFTQVSSSPVGIEPTNELATCVVFLALRLP